jgi:hypothetical protein
MPSHYFGLNQFKGWVHRAVLFSPPHATHQMPIVWWSSHPIAARYTSSELKAAAQTLREKNPFPMEMIKSLSVSESATRSNSCYSYLTIAISHRRCTGESAQASRQNTGSSMFLFERADTALNMVRLLAKKLLEQKRDREKREGIFGSHQIFECFGFFSESK